MGRRRERDRREEAHLVNRDAVVEVELWWEWVILAAALPPVPQPGKRSTNQPGGQAGAGGRASGGSTKCRSCTTKRARSRAKEQEEDETRERGGGEKPHKKLARSCGNAVRLLGSCAVSAYIIALVCGGADTLHRLRRLAAQSFCDTMECGQVPPTPFTSPPVHISCHANFPAERVAARSASMLAWYLKEETKVM